MCLVGSYMGVGVASLEISWLVISATVSEVMQKRSGELTHLIGRTKSIQIRREMFYKLVLFNFLNLHCYRLTIKTEVTEKSDSN